MRKRQEILRTDVIHKVRLEYIDKVKSNSTDLNMKGLFYAYDEKNNRYVGCDNSDCDAWTETFVFESECVRWLLDLS